MIKGLVQGFLTLVQRPTEPWDFGERRKLIRMRCHYPSQAHLDGKKIDAVISDMGLGGLRIKVFHPLKIGQRWVVESPFHEVGECNEPVETQVLWIQQPTKGMASFAGLKYVSPPERMGKTWVKGVLKELGFRPESILSKRRWVRTDCFLEGTLRLPNNSRQTIRIQNLGVGGVLFEYRGLLTLGVQQLRIGPLDKHPPLDVRGTLVKARPEGNSYLYSLEFDELQPAHLRLLSVYLKDLMKHSWE